MSAPVICAMLTTVGAFLPLFLIKGIIGQIIIAIPMVICAVLIASLIECFLVLPAHLAHFDKAVIHLENLEFGLIISLKIFKMVFLKK